MASRPAPRDAALLDALEALPHEPFAGTVWRVVRQGRDPTQCGAPGGRWDDATFAVLYTSLARDGAIAEMYFHLRRGQPIFPSQAQYSLHELQVELAAVPWLPTLGDLAALGVDVAIFGQLDYRDRPREYPRTQDIAETAEFLGCDGLIVPNARHPCLNLVIFCAEARSKGLHHIRDHGSIDWSAWRSGQKDAPPA